MKYIQVWNIFLLWNYHLSSLAALNAINSFHQSWSFDQSRGNWDVIDENRNVFFHLFFFKKDLKENIFNREQDMIFESFFSLCWWIEEKQLLHFILISQKIKGRIFYSSLTPKTCNYFVFLKLHILYAYLQIFQTILKTSYWRYEWIPTTVKTSIKSRSPTLCWTEIDRTSIVFWMSRLMLFKKWSKLKHLETFSFV